MDIIQTTRHGVPLFFCGHPAWTGAAHGFSTRLRGVSPAPFDSLNLGANRGDAPERVEENFRRFCAAVGSDPEAVVKNHQVHGKTVRRVTSPAEAVPLSQPGTCPADALVTDIPGVCLTVFSADCIPVLLYDPVRRVAAAAHAGWRGTAAGIVHETVGVMKQDYGCRPEDILAAIGPGISSCCFETHADVPDGLRSGLGAAAEPFIRPLPGGDTFRVDLKGANARWLEEAGLAPQHIALCPLCTACRPDLFWSHRRLGQARGSMAAMIQLKHPLHE